MPNLATIITEEMLQGVLTQYLNLIPVVMPVAIGYMAIRKGLSFLWSSLAQA